MNIAGQYTSYRLPTLRTYPSSGQATTNSQLRHHTILASHSGAALAIIGQQKALKYAPAGIAQALLATSPLFILPIAAWSGEKLSFRAIFGVGVAMAGITLLLFNR